MWEPSSVKLAGAPSTASQRIHHTFVAYSFVANQSKQFNKDTIAGLPQKSLNAHRVSSIATFAVPIFSIASHIYVQCN